MDECYVVQVYFIEVVDEWTIEHDCIYGIFTSKEKAKEAMKAFENDRLYTKYDGEYDGYSITEWEMDVAHGAIRDV